jgi:D-lyxose ketol-isomerase
MTGIDRRTMLAGLAGGAASLALLPGCGLVTEKEAMLSKPDDKDFYLPDGAFDAERAKQAYYEMFEYHGYPIPERLRGEDFWTLDFGLGKFSEVGMAGIFWINNQEHDYLGHEIYLLPGQMIPEHWHEASAEARAKVEGWHLRHGSVTLFSEGTPSPNAAEIIPPIHRDIAVARTATVLKPGEVGYLAAPLEKHWMLAGPEGAIVTEYGCYHDMAGLRFTHPDITL